VNSSLIIAGAPRSGTSALTHYLSQLPEYNTDYKLKDFPIISMPETLAKKDIRSAETVILSRYKKINLFSDVNIIYHSKSIENIRKYFGSKFYILVMLRNPVDRIVSELIYNQNRRVDRDDFAFSLKKSFESRHLYNKHGQNYFFYSLYNKHLDNLRNSLKNDENLITLNYEEFFNKKIQSNFKKLLNIINIKYTKSIDFKKINMSSEKINSEFLSKLLFDPKFLISTKSLIKKVVPIKVRRQIIHSIWSLRSSSENSNDKSYREKIKSHILDNYNIF